jgi:hypothetical protein
MIYVVNYADERYKVQQKYNTRTAYKKGKADIVLEYSPESVDETYKIQFSHIFSIKRGGGLWLWKPYIILDALDKAKEGDYIMYADSGSYFVNSINHLVNIMEQDEINIMTFENPLLERQWTKKETMVNMEYKDRGLQQIIATFILIKKNEFCHLFIQQWQHYMEDEINLSPQKYRLDIEEDEDFIAHREDQSVLSIFCHKMNVIPYREPSQYGDRPWEYARNNRICYEKNYQNSKFPRIVVSNRRVHPVKFRFKEQIKMILYWCNILNKWKYLKKIGVWGGKYIILD